MTATDLTPLLLDALGQRIETDAAQALAQALGGKPFKHATPNGGGHLGSGKLGIEVGTAMRIDNRAYFPPRKDGRRWVTWVSHAFVYPHYRGSLPAGFDWTMDEAALGANFRRRVEGAVQEVRYVLPAPREGLAAKAMLGSNGRPKCLLLRVAEEGAYATVYPDGKPEHSVEDGFFAAWAALNGVLRPDRLAPLRLDALRQRRTTPLGFLIDDLGGLLWEGDVSADHAAFCHAYMNRLMEPEQACALFDAGETFGDTNHWRKAGEAMTEDGWDNYDRIAPRYAQRWAQWQRGEIRSMVDWPDDMVPSDED